MLDGSPVRQLMSEAHLVCLLRPIIPVVIFEGRSTSRTPTLLDGDAHISDLGTM